MDAQKMDAHEEKMKLYDSLPELDESSAFVRDDALCQSLINSRKLARDYELGDLHKLLEELLRVLGGNTRNHRLCQRSSVSLVTGGVIDKSKSWSSETLKRKYSEYAITLKAAFEAPETLPTKAVYQLLGPKNNFDQQHFLQSMQESMFLHMGHNLKEDVAKIQTDFEQGDPIQTNLRTKEIGYSSALTKVKKCNNAQEADALAKKAFSNRKIWTAELWWEKAIELDETVAKYFSNLATLYIKIGRYLRSISIGYRGLATQYLERAVAIAKKGIAVDKSWERSFQRGAEALFAIGNYEHAMDVLKLLKPALDNENNLGLSDELKRLQSKAQSNATAWLSLRVIPGKTTVPQIINKSLENLRKVVIKQFSICRNESLQSPSSETLMKAGDDIADAVQLTLGALQLMYTRRLDWEIQSQNEKRLKMDIQIELREAAKLVPLETLLHSEKLKKMAFAEDPDFSLWGLDRLDRINADFLKYNAKDPCEDDDVDSSEMEEMMYRSTGESMPLDQIHGVLERFQGKQATSYDKDMSNHHLCAFTMNLLERVILSEKYPTLRSEVLERTIKFSTIPMASLMGGEFLGRVTKAASGFLSYTEKDDTSIFFEFIQFDGGLKAIIREICTGGDPHGYFQQLLCKLSPSDWETKSEKDLHSVLYEYCLLSMDKKYVCLKEEETSDYISKVLCSILSFFFSCDSFNSEIVTLIFQTSFGQFLLREIMEEQESPERFNSVFFNRVVPASLNRWKKLSNKKRSAYRW